MAVAALRSEVIEPSVLAGLRDEWAELWRRRPEATPFGAPAWLLPWARAYAPDRTQAIVVREAGRLEALVPLFTWRGGLHLAGAGPSDYGDALAPSGLGADLLQAACELAGARGCATVDLPQLRPGAFLLEAPCPRGWTDEIVEGEVCPVAPILGSDGLGAMAPNWRRKLDYARRRLGREAGHAYELATVENLPELAGALRGLHARRWSERGETGVLADPLMATFLDAALPELLADGLLRLHALRIEGRVTAAILAMHAHDAVFVYITGFDPEAALYSPGSLLWAQVIETAAAEGAEEVHFLRGREAYKRHWGAVDRPTWRRTLRRA